MPAARRILSSPGAPDKAERPLAAPIASNDDAQVVSAVTAAVIDEATHTGEIIPTEEGVALNIERLQAVARNLRRDIALPYPDDPEGIREKAAELLRRVEAIDPYNALCEEVTALVRTSSETMAALYECGQRRLGAEAEQRRTEQRIRREQLRRDRKAAAAVARQQQQARAAERAAQEQVAAIADRRRLEEERRARDADARTRLAAAAAARRAEREHARAEELQRFAPRRRGR